jgi:CRP-like cAMP-binding protein
MPEPFDLSELKLPTSSEYAALLARCPDIAPVRFNEGEYLIREGELTMETYIVIDGGYVVERQPNEKEGGRDHFIHSGIVSPENPCFVGEMAYLGGSFRIASIRSSGRTFALRLEASHLEIVIDDFPLITKRLCRQLIARIVEANKSIGYYQNLMKIDTEQILLEEGQILIEKGAKTDKLFQLIRGRLIAVGEDGEQELPKERLDKGFVDLKRFLTGGTWPETLKAKGPTIVIAIPDTERDKVVRNHPDLVLETLA